MINYAFKEQMERAKAVDVVKILAYFGFYPVEGHDTGARVLHYHSPLRKGEDKHPSFIVHRDNSDACWIDMAGYQSNGDTVNFVSAYLNLSCKEAVKWIIQNFCYDSAVGASVRTAVTTTAAPLATGSPTDYGYAAQQIEGVGEIKSERLVEYLRSRNISLTTANKYCREVEYCYKEMNFRAIGFVNDDGGYAIRSQPTATNPGGFKGVLKSSTISTIRVSSRRTEVVLMFEGFFDFLAYIELNEVLDYDVIVLNGAGNTSKVPYLSSQGVKAIHFYCDSDEAGKKAFDKMAEITGCEVRDVSGIYADRGLKDMSEYLDYVRSSQAAKMVESGENDSVLPEWLG